MHAKGYKVAAALEGHTLTATADGKIGRAALGADERTIDLTAVTALSFTPANRVKNGSLALVDARGKTLLHFRRKDGDAWRALYEALAERVPASAVDAETSGALVNEDRDDWHDRKMAEIESRKSS